MQELTPSMALELLKSGMRILATALITVAKTAIWRRRPYELRHRFGQHTQVVLAGFEPLVRSFLVIDIGAGANIFEDRALLIFERHGLHQEPAIRSGRALAQALFRLIGPACPDGALPHRQDALPVIRMRTLHPSLPLGLFGAQAGIVAPALIIIVDIPVRAPGPDQLGDGIDQGMDFSFGSLARGDVDAGNDEIVDVVVRIHVGDDRYLKVKEHLLPRANQGLEKDRLSRAGSLDGGTYLLLTGRRKGPPGGFGQRFADHLLASDVRVV